MKTNILDLQWPLSNHKSIVPVFLPFMGCKARCVFCAQDRQTGKSILQDSGELCLCLQTAKRNLEDFRERHGKSAELAFYGGTFTAFSQEHWEICLDFIEKCLSAGLISSFRCSTRPDALEAKRLEELKALACGMVELGIQSFHDEALRQSRRGYGREDALKACKIVEEKGLNTGVQLLPGMPGDGPEVFLEDVRLACELKVKLLRFYPCLVIANTGLAGMWQEGKYQPWSLSETISNLARAWNMARKAGIAVSRMGLAQDMALMPNILAGPLHASLGSRVQGLALYFAVREELLRSVGQRSIRFIYLPKRLEGCIWGWKGELKDAWTQLGLDKKNIEYWPNDYIRLEYGDY